MCFSWDNNHLYWHVPLVQADLFGNRILHRLAKFMPMNNLIRAFWTCFLPSSQASPSLTMHLTCCRSLLQVALPSIEDEFYAPCSRPNSNRGEEEVQSTEQAS